MKFWELHSVFREFDFVLEAVLNSEKWSDPYGDWLSRYVEICEAGDREKLDSEIPAELAIEVAETVADEMLFYLSRDGWLRSRRHKRSDKRLTALDALKAYGGSVLEETLEYGSCQVEP